MKRTILFVLMLLAVAVIAMGCGESSLGPEDEGVQPQHISYQQDRQPDRGEIPVQPGREQNIFDESNQPSTSPMGDARENDQAAKVLQLTNQAREEQGISPLQMDSFLASVAQEKADDMAAHQYFSHTSPTYGSAQDMLEQFGVPAVKSAENIAAGQTSAEEVVESWLNSEGHRRHILDAELTHLGVGYQSDGNYWTQWFIQR
ncbi:CAP domain-containing protein [Gracilibacillus phocaeensis]|uniref:CAP domain-containing protein n=1 Tax=Gracilibacillus phocaeensis TaxID=2042304 RepID=UPI0013EF250C|nr:CAP domain-containing protein [Gracilibacillus phocaeensis]